LNLGDHVGDEPANVLENRRRVADAIGVDANRLVIINQVHGRNVVNANEATPDSSGDVIVDFGDGFAVAVLIADCLPILLVDEDSPTLAVVHAGWRGLESNVIESALAHFEHHDAVHAFLGPSISAPPIRSVRTWPSTSPRFRERSRPTRVIVPGSICAPSPSPNSSRWNHRGPPHAREQVTDGGAPFFSDRATRPCGRFALVARRVIA